MRVTVDGIIYELQSSGGISRLFSEILPRMCNLDSSLQINLFTQRDCLQALPVHAQMHNRRIPSLEDYLRPRRFWRRHWQMLRMQTYRFLEVSKKSSIWHSTYYTDPGKWSGPRVVTVYDMIVEKYQEQFMLPGDEEVRQRKRRAVLNADAIISISETTKRDLLSDYNIQPEIVHVTPLSHSQIFTQLPEDAINNRGFRRPFLLYVGKRSHNKNFETLLNAYSLWRNREKVGLIAVGPAWSEDENRRLTKLNIQEKVLLTQAPDDKVLCDLYNQALAFVYPSLYEGFGIPLLEAMACGCPIIASRIPSTQEVAGDCPIYFEPLEVESLLFALESVFDESEVTHRVQAGLERVKNYSWERTARQTLDVYYSLNLR